MDAGMDTNEVGRRVVCSAMRQETWEVAKAANQIIRRVGGDEGCLYSENLY